VSILDGNFIPIAIYPLELRRRLSPTPPFAGGSAISGVALLAGISTSQPSIRSSADALTDA
jgi:hypothetical protein